MTGEGVRRAPVLSLRELYRVYTTIVAKPGEPVPLAAFKLSKEETEDYFRFSMRTIISAVFPFQRGGRRKIFC
jgi:hypothetical protein